MVTKKRSLVDIISDYVFTDLQPISTGEKEGFKRMFKELNPEITKISPPTPCGEPFVLKAIKCVWEALNFELI